MTDENNDTVHRLIVTFWGLTALLCVTIGCPANIIACSFFTRFKRDKTSGVLYILMTIVDALICGFGFVVGVTGILNNSKVCDNIFIRDIRSTLNGYCQVKIED